MRQMEKLQKEARSIDELREEEQETLPSNVGAEELLTYWHILTNIQSCALDVMRKRLPKTAELVEDSTLDLSKKFQELAMGANTQADQVQQIVDMAANLEVDGEQVSMLEFTELFDKTLSDSITRILYVSKMAMAMVYSLDDAIASLADIEAFVGRIQKINKQTNLLALNATIEASRAGESGKGFDVVANEVKTVSQEIASLALTMNEKVHNVTSSVEEGFDTLRQVATADMSDIIISKDRLDVLMESLVNRNEQFSSTLQGAANTSRELSQTISGMVVGMQFQDRTTQNISNCVNVLADVIETWRKLHITTEKQVGVKAGESGIEKDLIPIMAEEFKLGAFKQDFLSNLEEAGIIESAAQYGGLSAEEAERMEQEENNPEAATNGEEEVELF